MRETQHAMSLLPGVLREPLAACGFRDVEEIRLRAGRRLTVSAANTEREVPGAPEVNTAHINQVIENATRSSFHTAAEGLRRGYITSSGGCRVGVCGTAAVTNGEIGSIREISSLSVRVAREHIGIADNLVNRLTSGGRVYSTIIISPPGFGKTTLLRDLIRVVSDRGTRVSIADERGEIAAAAGGIPRFDVGSHTDVLTGAPKEQAVMALLRTMTPGVIALDEISEEEDARAVELAANCGTALFASVHGADRSDVFKRPVFSAIYSRGIFRRAVVIGMEGGRRVYRVEDL